MFWFKKKVPSDNYKRNTPQDQKVIDDIIERIKLIDVPKFETLKRTYADDDITLLLRLDENTNLRVGINPRNFAINKPIKNRFNIEIIHRGGAADIFVGETNLYEFNELMNRHHLESVRKQDEITRISEQSKQSVYDGWMKENNIK